MVAAASDIHKRTARGSTPAGANVTSPAASSGHAPVGAGSIVGLTGSPAVSPVEPVEPPVDAVDVMDVVEGVEVEVLEVEVEPVVPPSLALSVSRSEPEGLQAIVSARVEARRRPGRSRMAG